jgi:hypothetical protein
MHEEDVYHRSSRQEGGSGQGVGGSWTGGTAGQSSLVTISSLAQYLPCRVQVVKNQTNGWWNIFALPLICQKMFFLCLNICQQILNFLNIFMLYSSINTNIKNLAKHIILPTWEPEIQGILFSGQPGQNVPKTPSHPIVG